MPSSTAFDSTIDRLRSAVDATYRGDAQPYIDLWSKQEPVSLFGALGPCKTRMTDIERTFHWVASRFSEPQMTTDLDVVEVGQDMAYTVGYEQGTMALDGKQQPVRIRVTQIFRLEHGEWRMVHRHGDFAPQDDSPGAATRGNEKEAAASRTGETDSPVVLIARFDGDTDVLIQAYDKAHEGLKKQPGPPIGELRHHCAVGEDALYLIGVWRSAEHVRERFRSDGFEQVLEAAGFPSMKTADIKVLDLHATDPPL